MNKSKNNSNIETVRDLLLQIVGPILIMLMVGSLVCLLIEVCYRGPHNVRLYWVFGLFTFATVLVSRISIEAGLDRAILFGSALGLATLITGVQLVEFDYGALAILSPVVLLFFILVVMWSANRLTWDCTLIDDSRDVSSIGLTEIVKRKLTGADRKNSKRKTLPDDGDEVSAPSDVNPILEMFFVGSKSKNTPGLWVFYFSLAAFPIFGIGQRFAQRDPDSGYLWIFFLFAIYLGSGLGLLMLTSLLGLDRYLQKRGAIMPTAVMRNWLAVGTAFALLIMTAVLLVPSPDLSGGIDRSIAFLTNREKDNSDLAIGKDGKEDPERPRGEQAKNENDQPGQKDGKGGKQAGKSGDGEKGTSDQSGDKAGGKEKGDSKTKKQSKTSPKKDSKPGSKNEKESSSDQQKKPSDSQQDQPKDPEGKPSDKDNPNDKSPNSDDNNQADQEPNQQKKNQGKAAPAKQPDNDAQGKKQNQPPPSKPTPNVPKLGWIARAITYLVAFLILAILVWMFRDEIAKFWAELFGKKERVSAEEADETLDTAEPDQPLPAFNSFREPFSSGQATQWSASQTIDYTFAALEAWAREHQSPRDVDQTPFEFAADLAGLNQAVSAEAKQLAKMHGQSLFGGGDVSPDETSKLVKLWKLMSKNTANKK